MSLTPYEERYIWRAIILGLAVAVMTVTALMAITPRPRSAHAQPSTYTEYAITVGLGTFYSADFVPRGDHAEFNVYKVSSMGQSQPLIAHMSMPWASIEFVTMKQVPK